MISVPAGWSLVQMQDLALTGEHSVVGGPFGSELTREDYVASPGVPVIRGNNLDGKECRFIDDGFVFVSEQKAKSLVRNMAFPGDMVFTQRGTLGQVAVIPEKARFPRYVISQSQMKVSVDRSKAEPRYIYHYYRSPIATAELNARTLATGVPHINLSILKQFSVLLPPLPEQRRIAAILDKADAIRRKRQETIRLTEELLRSAFLEMFGDPVTNPKGWPTERLEQISSIASGVTKGRNLAGRSTVVVPYMRVANVQDMRIDLGDVQTIEVPAEEVNKFRLARGDVLLTEGGDPDKLGRGAVWNGAIDPCIHQNHIFRVRPDSTHLLPEYLAAFIASPRGKHYFLRAAKQTTGIATINRTQLGGLPVLLPPVALQRRFSNIVGGHERLQRRMAAHALLEDRLFHSLVGSAFTGQL